MNSQNTDELTADMYEMYRLHKCVGMPQTKVAAKFQVSQPTVSNYVRRVEERLRSEQRDEVSLLRTRMTARLEHVYAESMQGWEQSKLPLVVTSSKVEDGCESKTTRTTPQTGEAAYLRLAMESMSQVQGIWGTDMVASDRKGEPRVTGMSQLQMIEQKLSQLQEARNQLLQRSGGSSAGTAEIVSRN